MSRVPENTCAAGRTAFFGGRWKLPCPYKGDVIHVIAAPEFPGLRLCPRHFEQVNEAGLVAEPYIDPDEFDRRTGRA